MSDTGTAIIDAEAFATLEEIADGDIEFMSEILLLRKKLKLNAVHNSQVIFLVQQSMNKPSQITCLPSIKSTADRLQYVAKSSLMTLVLSLTRWTSLILPALNGL